MQPLDEISKKILLVDDEIRLLDGLRRQFRKEFEIVVAESAEKGFELLDTQGPFAVVVSDFNMPKVDGVEFLNQVYLTSPDTVLVMLTGRAELDVAVNALHKAHISHFLNKPCPREVLFETLQDGLEQYRLKKTEFYLQRQLETANLQLNTLNQQLEELVAQRTQILEVQYRYVASITAMNSEQIVAEFPQAISRIAYLDQVAFYLRKEPSPDFILRYSACPSNVMPSFSLSQAEGLIRLFNSSSSLRLHSSNFISSASADLKIFCGNPLICQPLFNENTCIGILTVSGQANVELDDSVIGCIETLSSVTAHALLRHWHQETQDDAQDAIITALAKLSEFRDPETGAHLLRLKKYCAILCDFLAQTEQYHAEITQRFIDDLVRCSPLHDIGKVGIADAILKKPGKLTEEEFEIMKTHAAMGGDTLRAIYEEYPSQSFIKSGMDVAYYHHEKWDGSGYPKGLKGSEIPLVARILALVDVYDALTARRVYKEPFPREKANALIIEGTGRHFDPDIVNAFLAKEADFHLIALQYADEN